MQNPMRSTARSLFLFPKSNMQPEQLKLCKRGGRKKQDANTACGSMLNLYLKKKETTVIVIAVYRLCNLCFGAAVGVSVTIVWNYSGKKGKEGPLYLSHRWVSYFSKYFIILNEIRTSTAAVLCLGGGCLQACNHEPLAASLGPLFASPENFPPKILKLP